MTKKPVIIIMLIACFMWVSFLFVEQAGQKVNTLKSIIFVTYKIKADLLMLRRYEKDFLSRYDKIYVDNFLNSSKIVQKDIENLKSLLCDLEILPKEGDKLGRIITNYEKTFIEIVAIQTQLGLSQLDGYYGKLREQAHLIEQNLIKLKAQDLMNLLLSLRRAEKDFMLRTSSEYLNVWINKVSIFKNTISKSTLPINLKNEIISLTNAYEEYHEQYVINMMKKGFTNREGHLALLIKYAHHFEYQLDEIIQNLLDISAIMEIKTHQYTRYMMIVFSLGVLLICAMGLFFVSPISWRKISSLLNQPVDQL